MKLSDLATYLDFEWYHYIGAFLTAVILFNGAIMVMDAVFPAPPVILPTPTPAPPPVVIIDTPTVTPTPAPPRLVQSATYYHAYWTRYSDEPNGVLFGVYDFSAYGGKPNVKCCIIPDVSLWESLGHYRQTATISEVNSYLPIITVERGFFYLEPDAGYDKVNNCIVYAYEKPFKWLTR